MRIAMLLALGLLWSVHAASQQKPALQISVANLDYAEAAECGISEKSIETVLADSLRERGVSVAQKTNPYLFVRATVLRTAGNACTFHFDVSVRQTRPAASAGAFKVKRGSTANVLC